MTDTGVRAVDAAAAIDYTTYTTPGPLTDLAEIPSAQFDDLPHDPLAISGLASGLVIQPWEAEHLKLALPSARFEEKNLRPAAELIRALLALSPEPLTTARPPERRLVGTCRHFATLTCALLRYRGIAARARCGFATYFEPGKGLDHWITEYWHEAERRWVWIDSEILHKEILKRPEDLAEGEFLTGGEAWAAYRRGEIDAATFGVGGTPNWGPAEIRGNAMRDLASLNKVETLPWDEWGRMAASYRGETGPDYDELLDTIAATCAGDDPRAIAELYAREELRVPDSLLSPH
ncbi:MAG TPA: transglutaminase domain-containing protein [Actinocrinis sp.]|uniref:transglutaminase domain-containing protein n=1 Tax=Actinocrinis sp. TaxID=1920516 RepID=UPI002D4C9A05|nr:transglutaminase domain-containing protein [Actinocrinis sp.]HZU54353.1 transglutaminase domain-containing protein [Actinocrinis sp.]